MELKDIKPGMFVRVAACSIYFEVESFLCGKLVVHASRDPKDKTDSTFINNIVDVVDVPPSRSWIKLNRQKGFYDKFHPEGWLPSIIELVSFDTLKEGDRVLTFKGCCHLIKKMRNQAWRVSGCQKTLAGGRNFFWLVKQVETAPAYN